MQNYLVAKKNRLEENFKVTLMPNLVINKGAKPQFIGFETEKLALFPHRFIIDKTNNHHIDNFSKALHCQYNAVQRAKNTILEISLNNEFKYFITITIDNNKGDRTNLTQFRLNLSKFFHLYNINMKRKGYEPIKYLLTFEEHKKNQNGKKCYHAHGLIQSNYDLELIKVTEDKGINEHFKPLYEKFGLCPFSKINDNVKTGYYVSKYITKNSSRLIGQKRYLCSKGLLRAEKIVIGERIENIPYYSVIYDEFEINGFIYENEKCKKFNFINKEEFTFFLSKLKYVDFDEHLKNEKLNKKIILKNKKCNNFSCVGFLKNQLKNELSIQKSFFDTPIKEFILDNYDEIEINNTKYIDNFKNQYIILSKGGI